MVTKNLSVGGVRNSSLELYRIIATFTVLIVHFNGWFVEIPERFDFAHITLYRIGQMIIEAATIICVNMFILISGYFGIKLRLSSVIKLCLLLALIYVPFYIWATIVLDWAFSVTSLIGRLFVVSSAGYFIQSYIMLMFFSPVLNAFVEKYGEKVLPWTIVFIAIEFWFDCVRDIENFGFNGGYSIVHFVLVYMVARCLALYKNRLLEFPKYRWILGYVACTLVISLMYLIGVRFAFSYSNPIVIMSSICSFIPFLYHNYYSKTVNWIAGGTLSVYIIQVTEPVHGILIKSDRYLLDNYNYFMYLMLGGLVLIITFIVGVLYHKIAISLVEPIVNKATPVIGKYKMS